MIRREKNILSVLSWIHAYLLFAGLYLLVPAMASTMEFSIDTSMKNSMLLFLPIIMSFFVLRKTQYLFVYLLVAGILVMGIYVLTHQILTVLCSGLIFLIRGYTRVERGRIQKQMRDYPGEDGRFLSLEAWETPTLLDQPTYTHWLFFLAEYFGLIFCGHHECIRIMFWIIVGEITVTLIYHYIFSVQEFVVGKQRIASLPSKTILRNGYLIFGGLLILFFLFLTPALWCKKEPLTALYHPLTGNGVYSCNELVPEQSDSRDLMEMIEEMRIEERQLPIWANALFQVFSWGMVTGLVCVFFWGILKAVRQMAKTFSQEEEDEVIDLKLMKEEGKRIRKEKRKKEQKKRNTAEVHIRKSYRKMILKSRKQKPQNYETPREVEREANLIAVPDAELFHELYEKARYSKEGCTSLEEQRWGQDCVPEWDTVLSLRKFLYESVKK